MKKQPTVIYHSADFDGIFCREIARKFMPESNLIGWNFGDDLISGQDLPGDIYILDLSPDCLHKETGFCLERIVWIDHHKSSIDKWAGTDFKGYRIDGVAACRLAWQWFAMWDEISGQPLKLPTKEDFIDRRVSEPEAVRLAGEYDIWDKRDPGAERFQFGLRSVDAGQLNWEDLLNTKLCPSVLKLIDDGEMLQRYQQRMDASLVADRVFMVEWEGLKFLTLNTGRFNSLTFASMDVPETGHDALLGFAYNGKAWTVSMYHAKHRTDLDLSKIAVKHGGGGHRGACGFVCLKLPFIER